MYTFMHVCTICVCTTACSWSAGRASLFTFSSNNAMVQLVSRGGPRILQNQVSPTPYCGPAHVVWPHPDIPTENKISPPPCPVRLQTGIHGLPPLVPSGCQQAYIVCHSLISVQVNSSCVGVCQFLVGLLDKHARVLRLDWTGRASRSGLLTDCCDACARSLQERGGELGEATVFCPAMLTQAHCCAMQPQQQ